MEHQDTISLRGRRRSSNRFAIEVMESRYDGGGIVEKVDAPGVELRRLGAGFLGESSRVQDDDLPGHATSKRPD